MGVPSESVDTVGFSDRDTRDCPLFSLFLFVLFSELSKS
jgi:hypothetical protein